jgi:hypothetical protein
MPRTTPQSRHFAYHDDDDRQPITLDARVRPASNVSHDALVGGVKIINMDAAESISIPDPQTTTAESLFERRWAFTLLESVMGRLRDEYDAAGRITHYEQLKPCLTAERGSIDYEALGAALGLQPASARSAVHRLRKRFRELFRDEVSSTVADPADVDDELRAVIAALSSD